MKECSIDHRSIAKKMWRAPASFRARTTSACPFSCAQLSGEHPNLKSSSAHACMHGCTHGHANVCTWTLLSHSTLGWHCNHQQQEHPRCPCAHVVQHTYGPYDCGGFTLGATACIDMSSSCLHCYGLNCYVWQHVELLCRTTCSGYSLHSYGLFMAQAS